MKTIINSVKRFIKKVEELIFGKKEDILGKAINSGKVKTVDCGFLSERRERMKSSK